MLGILNRAATRAPPTRIYRGRSLNKYLNSDFQVLADGPWYRCQRSFLRLLQLHSIKQSVHLQESTLAFKFAVANIHEHLCDGIPEDVHIETWVWWTQWKQRQGHFGVLKQLTARINLQSAKYTQCKHGSQIYRLAYTNLSDFGWNKGRSHITLFRSIQSMDPAHRWTEVSSWLNCVCCEIKYRRQLFWEVQNADVEIIARNHCSTLVHQCFMIETGKKDRKTPHLRSNICPAVHSAYFNDSPWDDAPPWTLPKSEAIDLAANHKEQLATAAFCKKNSCRKPMASSAV